MKVFLSKAPNVLLESVEMLYAYVNEIPVRELAGEGSYCIPVHIMQKMMDTACAGMSRNNPTLQFFLKRRSCRTRRNSIPVSLGIWPIVR